MRLQKIEQTKRLRQDCARLKDSRREWRKMQHEYADQRQSASTEMTLDGFFTGHDESRHIFEALHDMIVALGPAEMRVTKSQVAFRRCRAFAWAWMPGMYLGGKPAPLVLTLALRRRDPSPRWKEIVEPRPGRFTHHMELRASMDIDEEIRAWLQQAWADAR